jgi:hypothetical protein
VSKILIDGHISVDYAKHTAVCLNCGEEQEPPYEGIPLTIICDAIDEFIYEHGDCQPKK